MTSVDAKKKEPVGDFRGPCKIAIRAIFQDAERKRDFRFASF
ncbi:hypothetical protein CKO41_08805 [Thiococcus pfennigii]|nr:hypothetical protein [Thiococcus pfennigii]MBK1731887.1 hypothetical protein [Thiococcus pfennigii]